MVRPERFELPTYSSGGCRSIQLSYGRARIPVYMRSFSLSIGGSKVGVRPQATIAEPSDRIKFDWPRTQGNLITIPAAPAAVGATTAIAAISTTSTAAFDFRTRFVHVQGASTNLSAIECRDGFLSVLRARHLHEAEAARAPRVPIRHDADPVHLSIGGKKLAQFILRGIEVEVANENVLQADAPILRYLSVGDSAAQRTLVGQLPSRSWRTVKR